MVTDLKVLAEGAQEVTGTEEDGAGTVSSYQRNLFPEMGGITGNDGFVPCSADPCFPGQPVDPAVAGAEPTGGRDQDNGPVNPFL